MLVEIHLYNKHIAVAIQTNSHFKISLRHMKKKENMLQSRVVSENHSVILYARYLNSH